MTILNKRLMGFAFSMLFPVAAAAQTASHSAEGTPIDGTTGQVFRLVAPPEPVGSDSSFQRAIGVTLGSSSAGTNTAYRVTLVTMYDPDDPQPLNQPDFSIREGEIRYLNLLRDNNGDIVTDCVDSPAFGTTYPCATVACTPEFVDWGALFGDATVYLSGNAIIPDSIYTIAHLAPSCVGNEANCPEVSSETTITTARWGDSEPNGSVNVIDIVNVVGAVEQVFGALPEYHVYHRVVDPTPQSSGVNVTCIVLHIDALKLVPYLIAVNSCP
jgi:hypothetical protein